MIFSTSGGGVVTVVSPLLLKMGNTGEAREERGKCGGREVEERREAPFGQCF